MDLFTMKWRKSIRNNTRKVQQRASQRGMYMRKKYIKKALVVNKNEKLTVRKTKMKKIQNILVVNNISMMIDILIHTE